MNISTQIFQRYNLRLTQKRKEMITHLIQNQNDNIIHQLIEDYAKSLYRKNLSNLDKLIRMRPSKKRIIRKSEHSYPMYYFPNTAIDTDHWTFWK